MGKSLKGIIREVSSFSRRMGSVTNEEYREILDETLYSGDMSVNAMVPLRYFNPFKYVTKV